MPNYAPGQNPRYNKTFLECMHEKPLRFYTRLYAGILPAYPHDDLDIWIDKPGYVDSVMHGQAPPPPLKRYRVEIISAQDKRHNVSFEADDANDIIYTMAFFYHIPVTKIGWDNS